MFMMLSTGNYCKFLLLNRPVLNDKNLKNVVLSEILHNAKRFIAHLAQKNLSEKQNVWYISRSLQIAINF